MQNIGNSTEVFQKLGINKNWSVFLWNVNIEAGISFFYNPSFSGAKSIDFINKSYQN